MSVADRRIGGNLQALRGNLSQAALAALMKERGWKWSQPTVAAVEKGERPLKLAEAEHLVEILGLGDMEALTVRPFRTLADAAHDRMVRSADALRLAVVEYWQAQSELAVFADESGDEATDVDRAVWEVWLNSAAADPAHIIETVAPSFPVRAETFDRDADLAKSHPWAHKLSQGAYGVHSQRSRGYSGGQAADTAE